MFIIINGKYKVQTAMYNMKNKRADLDANVPLDLKAKRPNVYTSKTLLSGDIFGEVSLLFGCKRTATVKAKMYSQCAKLNQKDFTKI